MAVFENTYSRFVAGLKIILPLVAIGILASLFLVSKKPTSGAGPNGSDGSDSQGHYKPGISNPSLSGVTENGTHYTLNAGLAQPIDGNPESILLTEIAGFVTSAEGLQVEFFASAGSIEGAESKAVLKSGVRLITSDGYQIETDQIEADFSDVSLVTSGQIVAEGPMGQITAGQMLLQQQSQTGSGTSYELIFKNGVKVVYSPAK